MKMGVKLNLNLKLKRDGDFAVEYCNIELIIYEYSGGLWSF